MLCRNHFPVLEHTSFFLHPEGTLGNRHSLACLTLTLLLTVGHGDL